jgi:hypothetical protein
MHWKVRLAGIALTCGSVVTAAACSSSSTTTGNNDSNGKDAATDGSDASTGMDGGGQDAGCPATGMATVTGTLLGNTVAPMDAVSSTDNQNSPYVLASDYANACAVGLNNTKANSNTITFSLMTTNPFAARTYAVPNEIDVEYWQYDATCTNIASTAGTSGSVTVTKADACSVAGTFDVTFGTDHITGTFTAPACAPPSADAGSSCK